MTPKTLEDYSLDDYRRLRKGAFLLPVVALIPAALTIYLITYMWMHQVPQAKIHRFASLVSSIYMISFWAIIYPKTRTVSKLLQLHPDWKKTKFMTAKLSPDMLTQLILLPLGMLLILGLAFHQFYQLQKLVETQEPIPSVNIPKTSYPFKAE